MCVCVCVCVCVCAYMSVCVYIYIYIYKMKKSSIQGMNSFIVELIAKIRCNSFFYIKPSSGQY